MLIENFKMAFSSLAQAKLRSFLTMLGIIIGVAAVVAILAIGQGVKDAVQGEIAGVVNANAIGVASGKIDTQAPGSGGGGLASAVGTPTLTLADIDAIKDVDGVKAAAPIGIVAGLIGATGKTAQGALIVATSTDYRQTLSDGLGAGRWFSGGETASDLREAVIGSQTAKSLYGTVAAEGQTINLRGKEFTVVGVLKAPAESAASGLGGNPFDNAAFVSYPAAQNLTGSAPQVFRIIAQTGTGADVNAVAAQMRAAIKESHGGQDDFTVLTQADLLSTIGTVLNLLTTFIVAIAAISLVVGGIGIMNIMLVSVTERTREIGLRKAIGASSSTVLGQFLIEAVVLSAIGGLLGVVTAIAGATAIGRLAGITPGFTWQSIVLAVGVSAGVGVVFGLAPAIQAARKRPIQALKAT